MARADLSAICPGMHSPRASSFLPDHLDVIGEQRLLEHSPLGLLCSNRPPGTLVFRTFELFQRIKRADVTVIGGFHSPMERQCLELLLEGSAGIVVVPARGLASFRMPSAWNQRHAKQRLAVVSPFPRGVRRVSRALAEQRNRFVALLSARLFVPYAAPGGLTERIALETAAAGTPVLTFDVTENTTLLRHGAGLIESEVLNHYLAADDDPFAASER
jgi:predicted Rossmann fold nucleotide-binding protein DprA/Smf involved in DNA uptake